jgi:hypothetical protein
MRIKAMQIKRTEKARRLVQSLRLLATSRQDLPWLRPGEWLDRLPGLSWHTKLHVLVLHPRPGELQGWELARAAAGTLEARAGVVLDWAVGFRASGAVWLLLKPWASEAATGRRVWFRVAPGDLAALRAALGSPRPVQGRGRGEGG